MKKITDSLLKRIVRQSLNESYGLLNEATFATGKITSGGVDYENLDIAENPCPRGGFCLTPATNSGYNMASKFVKGTSVPGDYTEQITWMESVIALCNNEEYSKGEPMDEATIGNIVTAIQDEMDDTNIDEPLIKKKIISLGDFPSFCIANEKSQSYGYDIFGSNAESRMNYGAGDNDDYKLYIVLPVFQLLQNSISKTKKFEPKFWESVATAAKTQKPKPTIGGGGTENFTLDIGSLPCVVEHPALINKKEPLDNGFGFRLKTGNPVIDDFTFGVTKDPNVPDSMLQGRKFSNKSQILLDFNCDDKYIQWSLSSDVWNYDDVAFGGAWDASAGGSVALTTDPDLEDDGKVNQSIQTEIVKGFRHNLLTEAEFKVGDKGPEVGKIQSKLGLKPDKGTPIYGPATKAAVEKFQTDNGITPVTGNIDAATYDKILQKFPDPIQQTGTGYTQDLKVGMSGTDVEFIQTKLGISKGKYGPETEKKVKEFQIKYKLPETGIVDKTTYDKLIQVKAAGTPSTFSAKKHNYVVGQWIKVTPENGNEANQLTENNGYFRIIKVPNDYTIILDLPWGNSKGFKTIGGSTQRVLFGEDAKEGTKQVIKRDRNTNNNNNNNNNTNSGRRSNNSNSGTNTVNTEKQKQRDVRNKEFCDTLRQVKQYINDKKGGDLTVNCKKTQKTLNQIMMAITGGTIGAPVAPVAPVEVPDNTPGGNNVRIF